MQGHRFPKTLAVVLLLAGLMLSGSGQGWAVLAQDTAPESLVPEASATSTAFTYQGQLKENGALAQGAYRLQFSLWDAAQNGNEVGTAEIEDVTANNGLFTVTLNATNQFGADAFSGDARWLEIRVCPSNHQISCAALGTTLTPRQPLTGTPYALGLRPGTKIRGSAYQVVKIQSDAATGSIPAAMTGEMMSALDGVGVYGSNNSNATGSAGAGVWGRTWNLAGAGVKGTGFNGSAGVLGEAVSNGGIGVKAISNGTGINQPALYAEATNDKTTAPAGIAVFAKNHGGDATIVAQNTGAGDSFRSLNAAGNNIIFRVTTTGRVVASAVEIYGGGDLAERFDASAGVKIEPGTLMVIDDAHPGQLKPSVSAYDTKVAGVVSGAGGVNPGLTLHQSGVMEGNTQVAIAGRVYVKAEAISAPIKPGDLLTSSALPGTAMKASDRTLGQGAVIGKAMTGLDSGQGLVLVLVSLQ
ncbi:MAG: hypothetical protein NT169_29155 [Chloroflexi bacterium]|nr:hypothetical protein [Chloroflexota bacterium]